MPYPLPADWCAKATVQQAAALTSYVNVENPLPPRLRPPKPQIAWVDGGTNPTSLWTASPDGSSKQKLAEGLVASPSWAKDGRLAYLDGDATAVIVNGSSVVRVQLPFARVTSLAWSPDGARFVVTALATGAAVPDVYTLRTDGTDVRRLTTDFDAAAPSWR